MYHKSNLGSFGENLPCDIDGYVPEVGDGAFSGNWDHGTESTHAENDELTEYGEWWRDERFPEIVAAAVEASQRAQKALVNWQTK